MQEQCLSRQAAAQPAFETAYLIAAGWLLGLNSAAGTGLREQGRSDAQVFIRT